ncbi:MAG TPA: AAA family ATPase, partial [Longimicrobiaceae bacterium]|nr:AAA family ATPase [Longimicrobiaceae bacterium]
MTMAPREPAPLPWNELLRAVRATAGISQEAWAQLLGYGRRTAQRWERGALVPNAAQVEAIIARCSERQLFRTYTKGPLRGVTLTPEAVREVLTEARLDRGHRAPRSAGVRPTSPPDSALDAAPASSRAGETQAVSRSGRVPFVGRLQGLAALLAGFDAARQGDGSVILLAGEPGIGKTRLAEELAVRAGAAGARVLWGRCWEGEGAPAFWPWTQIIRAFVQECGAEAFAAAAASGTATIAQLAVELRDRLPDLPAPPSLEPAQARFHLFDSVTRFLRGAAGHQPLVLVLDDLHWADAPSLLLLQFLARELRGARLLVLGSYREAEVNREHPLTQALAELAREPCFERVPLRGFNEEDVTRCMTLLSGREPPPSLAAVVFQETEGNPFFITQIVRLLAAEGLLERPEEGAAWHLTIPQSVREVIGRRLDQLSAACNRLLTTAAVIGREFSLGALERASPLGGARLLELLAEAEAARVVTDVPGALGRFRFAHALMRETLYEDLTPSLRVQLHRRVGEGLEALYEANPEPYLAELAHHFYRAAPGGDRAKAINYAVLAAERATRLLAYEEAVRHYEMALQLLELGVGDEEGRCDLLLARGEAQNRAGAREQAQEAFRQAASIARR